MKRLAAALILASLGGCVSGYPVARVLFSGIGQQGATAAWVGKDSLITVPHVAVGDKCRVFARSMGRWVSAYVTFRAPAWALIRLEDGTVRPGDSGSPVLNPDGLLIGLVEAGRTF